MQAPRNEKASVFLKITNLGAPCPIVLRFNINTKKDFEDFVKDVRPFLLLEEDCSPSACF